MINRHHLKTFIRKGWFCFHTQHKSLASSDRDVQINRGISSSITKCIFESRVEHPYNLQCISHFSAILLSTVFHGTESNNIFLRSKFWRLLPKTIKNIDSLENQYFPISTAM